MILSRSLFLLLLMMVGYLQYSLISAQAKGMGFIRDTEIENTLRFYTAPIFEAAGLNAKVVKIFIINDDNLNAFVTNGQKIFINTGTLRKAELPEEVIGVLAHEAGHITGGHLAKLHNDLERANNLASASMLLGIPLALLTGRGDIALAASSFGLNVAERDLLSYTRANEQSADQAGVDFMIKANINPNGLNLFMEKLNQQAKLYQTGTPNPYLQTHPLSDERLAFLRNEVKKFNQPNLRLPDFYYVLHKRMRLKLTGFLEDTDKVLQQYPVPTNDTDFLNHYARAIAFMRLAKFDASHDAIDQLLAKHPKDPFYLELKGDIARDAGDLDAAKTAYEKAVALLPWSGLIRISLAQILIDLNDPTLETEALSHLAAAKAYEPDHGGLWRSLGKIYARREDKAMLALINAEIAIRGRDILRAKTQSELAINQLNRNSTAYQRARDILNQAQLMAIEAKTKKKRRR